MSRVKQLLAGNDNRVSGRDLIDIAQVTINLPAATVEPEAWCKEIEAHRQFKKEVGIDCSYPARRELCRLLSHFNFTPRQIKRVWNNNTLFYDDSIRRLGVRPSRAEAAFGAVFFALVVSLTVAPLLFNFGSSGKSYGEMR